MIIYIMALLIEANGRNGGRGYCSDQTGIKQKSPLLRGFCGPDGTRTRDLNPNNSKDFK